MRGWWVSPQATRLSPNPEWLQGLQGLRHQRLLVPEASGVSLATKHFASLPSPASTWCVPAPHCRGAEPGDRAVQGQRLGPPAWPTGLCQGGELHRRGAASDSARGLGGSLSHGAGYSEPVGRAAQQGDTRVTQGHVAPLLAAAALICGRLSARGSPPRGLSALLRPALCHGVIPASPDRPHQVRQFWGDCENLGRPRGD